MRRLKARAVAMLMAMATLLVTAPVAVAADNQPLLSAAYSICLSDSIMGNGTATDGCEGAICWCCRSDGCYVCNGQGEQCAWEPGRRVVSQQLLQNLPGQGITVQPSGPGQVSPAAPPQR